MNGMTKPIILSGHAVIQSFRRGTTEEEIKETIQASKWQKAELGKLECSKNFPFNKTWNGKIYAVKQVRPIFAEEEKNIIVITVYVYYF